LPVGEVKEWQAESLPLEELVDLWSTFSSYIQGGSKNVWVG
jgi:hypothetical protein